MGKYERVLSRRYLRGYDILKTLISVGCSNFKFDRLFEIVDQLIEEGVLTGEVIAQTGYTDYKIKNYEHFEFISNDEMNKFQNDSDLIICHAGTGTVVGSIKKGKKVIVFPRLKKFDEHESDNQLELAEQFASEGYVLTANDKESLIEAIKTAETFIPKKFVSNKDNFVNLIKSLLPV